MYTKELFHETVGILVKAYMNDTLTHGDCAACAVGNIIQHRMNLQYGSWEPSWYAKYVDGENDGNYWFSCQSDKAALQEIKSTGYSIKDTLRIEKAFESVDPLFIHDATDELMFNGLMSVVEVLCDIHGMNEEEKKEAKELFVKH